MVRKIKQWRCVIHSCSIIMQVFYIMSSSRHKNMKFVINVILRMTTHVSKWLSRSECSVSISLSLCPNSRCRTWKSVICFWDAMDAILSWPSSTETCPHTFLLSSSTAYCTWEEEEKDIVLLFSVLGDTSSFFRCSTSQLPIHSTYVMTLISLNCNHTSEL